MGSGKMPEPADRPIISKPVSKETGFDVVILNLKKQRIDILLIYLANRSSLDQVGFLA